MNENRNECPIRHPDYGNCTCVGGFCAAVPDEICVGLQNAYFYGKKTAEERFSHLKLIEFSERIGREEAGEYVAVFDDRVTSEEEVRRFLPIWNMGYNPNVIIATKEQWNNLFRKDFEK